MSRLGPNHASGAAVSGKSCGRRGQKKRRPANNGRGALTQATNAHLGIVKKNKRAATLIADTKLDHFIM